MGDELPIESTEVTFGHEIKHYSDGKFMYKEFQPLEMKRPDTILDKLERLILTSLFFVTVIGIVFIIHCL